MTTPDYVNKSPLLSSFTSSNVPIMTGMSTEKTPKKIRCEHTGCRAKLGLLGFDCKCGAKFCGAHRHPETHDCGYNHKAAAEAVLKKNLIACTGDKLGGDRI